ncbi:MAG: hypothetical protein JWM04_1519 [Verrucomicrobiales bacterium]|jgi:hypothetical protein|nr:hypothetical protein [Verrucomicrobiales bacterium]
MCSAEMISEIPKLSHEARWEIMRFLIEAETESAILAENDRRALERFQALDQMESADQKNGSR